MKIIITDSKYKMTLAPIRSLAKAGHEVICCDYEGTPAKERLGALSRYCSGSFTMPYDEDSLVTALTSIAQGERPVLFPSGRRMLDVVSRHGELAEKMDCLVSSADTLDRADDKGAVRATAQYLGVKTPVTRRLSEFAGLDSLASAVSFPCIIKYPNGEALGLKSWERYSIVNDTESFKREYARMNDIQADPLAQDYLPGHDVGVALVTDKNAKVVDFICYESLREYPISGGPTCLCRTIFDRELVQSAAKIVESIGFVGVAMLDFRRTEKGDFFLEVNPRLWGSASLCDVAGASFFESCILAARGEKAPVDLKSCDPGYILGAKMRFTPQAVIAVLQEVKRGNIGLLFKAAFSALNFRIKDGLFSPKDPKPYFRYISNLLHRSGGDA